MGDRAANRLTCKRLRPGIRRAMATVCAVAFLIVAFAHGIHHFDFKADQAIPTATVQVDGGFADYPRDPSNEATIAIDHCHGCIMIATEVVAPATIAPSLLSRFPEVIPVDLRPLNPAAETPPPIFTN